MNDAADYVHGAILTERQTGVLTGDTICMDDPAFGRQHDNNLGDEIHKLLKFLFRTLPPGNISDRSRDNDAVLHL